MKNKEKVFKKSTESTHKNSFNNQAEIQKQT